MLSYNGSRGTYKTCHLLTNYQMNKRVQKEAAKLVAM